MLFYRGAIVGLALVAPFWAIVLYVCLLRGTG
jgi:hypothetical protein